MARKPVSQMSAAEREEYRAYMREAKARSRSKRKPGECLSCGGPTAKRGGKYLVTCDKCNERSRAHDAAKGFPMRPSVAIRRGAIRMRKEGMTLNDIVRALSQYEPHRDYVRDVLREEGLM